MPCARPPSTLCCNALALSTATDIICPSPAGALAHATLISPSHVPTEQRTISRYKSVTPLYCSDGFLAIMEATNVRSRALPTCSDRLRRAASSRHALDQPSQRQHMRLLRSDDDSFDIISPLGIDSRCNSRRPCLPRKPYRTFGWRKHLSIRFEIKGAAGCSQVSRKTSSLIVGYS